MNSYKELLNETINQFGENEKDIIFINIPETELITPFVNFNQTGADNEKPPLLAWTKERVYFSHEYDGEIEIYSVPRHPSSIIPHGHIGEYKYDQFDKDIESYYARKKEEKIKREQRINKYIDIKNQSFLRENAPTQKEGLGFTKDGWFGFTEANFYNRFTDDYDAKILYQILLGVNENQMMEYVEIRAMWDYAMIQPVFALVGEKDSSGWWLEPEAKQEAVKMGIDKNWVYPVQ